MLSNDSFKRSSNIKPITEEEVIIRINEYDQSSIILYRKQLFRLDPSYSERVPRTSLKVLVEF